MSWSRQTGLNLIELMIAIVIGIFISLMVVQYLSTSARLFKQQGADTNLEANGTFAISYMTQFIRQAGSNDPMGTDVPFYTGECGDANPCTFNEDNPGESDQIAVQMVPQNGKDCVGNDVEEGDRIANVFYVIVERYVDASRVADSADNDFERRVAWDGIRSTKIAVLVSDLSTAGTEPKKAREYQLLDSPEVVREDRISRKVYSTTININNKLP